MATGIAQKNCKPWEKWYIENEKKNIKRKRRKH